MISDDLDFMLAFPPEREGYTFTLWQHRLTNLYQWINDDDFAYKFDMLQIYPAYVSKGFGLDYFGRTPFGS